MRFPFRFLVPVLAVILLAGTAAAAGVEELLKFLPSGSEYVIAVDLDRFRTTSGYAKMLQDNAELKEWIAQFEEQYQVRLKECRSLLWAGGGKRVRGTLLEVAVSEQALVKSLKAAGGRYSAGKLEGRTIHYLVPENGLLKPEMRFALCYLAPTVALVTEDRYLGPFLAGLKAPGASRPVQLERPEGTPVAWASFDVRSMLPGHGKKNNPLLGAFGNLRRALVDLNFTGDDGRGIVLKATGTCRDANSAALLGMTLPSYFGMGVAFLFAQDAQLGQQMLNALHTGSDGNRVTAELVLDAALVEQACGYLAGEIRSRIIPPDPVPPDLQNRR